MKPTSSRYYTYIKPLARNKFVRSYATTVFNLIAIAIFAFYAIRPTVITILSLQKSLTEQKNVLNSVVEKRNNLAKGRNNYENLDSSIKTKINTLVPTQPNLPLISTIISSLITQYQATVSGIQFQPVDLKPDTNTLNKDAAIAENDFSFSMAGSYSKIIKILENLKKMERLITIKTVNMTRLEDGSILTVVNAKAYYISN